MEENTPYVDVIEQHMHALAQETLIVTGVCYWKETGSPWLVAIQLDCLVVDMFKY